MVQPKEAKVAGTIQDKEDINVYTDPKEIEAQWSKLHEEYMYENEKEIPQHSSKILYQCLHPLQDTVQDAFSHLVHERSENSFRTSGIRGTGRQYLNQEQHQTAAYAYEYLILLEELYQAAFYQEQKNKNKKKQNDFLSGVHQIGFKKKQQGDQEDYSNLGDESLTNHLFKNESANLKGGMNNFIDQDLQQEPPPLRYKLLPDSSLSHDKVGESGLQFEDIPASRIKEESQKYIKMNNLITTEENEEDYLLNLKYKKGKTDIHSFGNGRKGVFDNYSIDLDLGKIQDTTQTNVNHRLFKDKEVQFSYREWIRSQENCLQQDKRESIYNNQPLPANIGLINEEDQKEEDLISHADSKINEAVATFQQVNLREILDETTVQPGECKQYRLSMWRLDKEKLTKLIVAEQTFTVWEPDFEVLKNKFCFSIDKKLIYITFRDQMSDIIKKTIVFRSLDLSSLKFEFNHNLGQVKCSNLVEDPVLYMDSDSDKNFDEDYDFGGRDRETIFLVGNSQQTQKNYFMYFQDYAKGYFCYTDVLRNSEFNLTHETVDPETERVQIETIKHIFFGQSEEKDHFIVLSQIERQYLDQKPLIASDQNLKVILYKVQTINMYSLILSSNKQIKEIWGGVESPIKKIEATRYSNLNFTRSTYIMVDKAQSGLCVQKAFYNKRHGIILEVTQPYTDNNQPNLLINNNMKSLMLISSAIIAKNLPEVEPKFYQIQNLRIPLNASYQSKLCMKGSYKQEDYLFFFEDLVNNKGQFEVMFENKQLIKVAPNKQILDATTFPQSNIAQQFCDFIVSTEKNSNVNEVTITDVDIDTSDEFLSRPLINFITHNYLINSEPLQQNFFQKNGTTVQQQLESATKQQTLVLDFECFLELHEPELVLANGNRYSRHQVCMMLTYDLSERCHRVQCIIMPSFNQMSKKIEVFSILTLPYQIDLNVDPGSIKNIMITGNFLQLKRYSHKSHQGKKIQEQIIDQLLLQFFDAIVQINLSKLDQPRKLLLEMDAFPLMENRAANLKLIKTDLNGKLLKELMIKSQALQWKDFNQMSFSQIRQKFGDRRYYLVLQPGYNYGNFQSSTHIWLLEVSCQEIELEKQVVYEFVSNLGEQPSEILQMSLSQHDSDGLTLLTIDRQFIVKKFKIKVKSKNVSLRLIDEALPNEEAEKLWSDILLQDQKLLMPEVSLNFKNLNPREVNLTDTGFYLDNMFFSNIFKSNSKKESLLEFEQKREKFISSKFHNHPSSDVLVNLNFSGALFSPDQTSLLLSFRRQKNNLLPLLNNNTSKRIQYSGRMKNRISKFITFKNRETSNIYQPQIKQIDHRVGFFFLSVPLLTSKIKQLLPMDSIAHSEVEFSTFLGHECDDLLVKLKNIKGQLGILIFSSIGQLRDLKVNNSNENLKSVLENFNIKQFLACSKNQNKKHFQFDNFSKKNTVINRSETNMNQLIEFQETLNTSSIFEENQDNSLPELIHKILMTNDITGQFAVLNLFRVQDKPGIFNYTLEMEHDHPQYIYPFNQQLHVFSIAQPDFIITKIKLQLDTKGQAQLIRFIFDTRNLFYVKIEVQNSRSNSTFQILKQPERRIKNFLFFGIDYGRQSKLEETFFHDIINKDVNENPHLKKPKKQPNITTNNNKQSLFYKRKLYTTQLDKDPLLGQEIDELLYQPEDFEVLLLPKFKYGAKEKEYIVFKCRQKIFYAELQHLNGQLGNEKELQDVIKKINVEFREPGFITQILQVQRPYQLQIMYHERQSGNFYMIIWDLVKNQEIQMQTFKTTPSNPFYQIFKGSMKRENYLIYIGSPIIQDLRLELTQNYLSGQQAWKFFDQQNFSPTLAKIEVEKFNKSMIEHYNCYRDEIKISHSCTKSLGLYSYGLTQLQRSYSYIDLQYLQYLFQRFLSPKAKKEDSRKPLIFEYLSVQMPFETNIMHFFATNHLFLELYLQELQSKNQIKLEENDLNFIDDPNMSYAYYPLFPNSLPILMTRGKGRRPFSIALKSNQGECFQMIIEILMCDPKRCYIKEIKPYLEIILVQKSEKVREFLSHRMHRYLFNQQISSHFLDHLKKTDCRYLYRMITCREQSIQQFNPSVTQYINDDASFFMQKKQKKSGNAQAKENEMSIKKSKEYNKQLLNKQQQEKVDLVSKQRVNETYSDDENEDKILQYLLGDKSQKSKKKLMEDKMLIQLQSFDFEGYMHGVKAENFLKFLISQTNNLGIFELKYIQKLIEFQWQKVSRFYYFVIAIYNIKIFIMLFYIVYQQALINCQTEVGGDPTFACQQTIFNRIRNEKWDRFSDYFLLALLPLQILVTLYEISRYERISKFQGLIIILFNLLHLVKLATDQMLILLFRVWYLRYNLQAKNLDEGYWKITDPDLDQSVDREYLMRASGAWIFIIKGGNSFLLISLPLICLYKLRFHPFISVYIPRFFLVLSTLFQMLIFFILLSGLLQFSYRIVSVLSFNTPSKDSDKLDIPNSLILWVDRMSLFNTLYRETMLLGISAILICISLYGAAAMIKADFQVSKNFKAQKYINLAKLLYQGGLLQNKEEKFLTSRYVIQSIVEKSNDTFGNKEALKQDEDTGINNESNLSSILGNGGRSSTAKNGSLSDPQNVVSVQNIRELLAIERQQTDQQLKDIKGALQNLERRLVSQESDAFDKK